MLKGVLSDKISAGKVYRIPFVISANMLEDFIKLTADASSLHHDPDFARRSAYRDQVVHGMLPVSFIWAVKMAVEDKVSYCLSKVSANFLKPVFVNDQLELTAKIVAVDEALGSIQFEYTIGKLSGNVIATRGQFSIKQENVAGVSAVAPEVLAGSGGMVLDDLNEADLRFAQISRGDARDFRFLISAKSAEIFLGIMAQGLGDPALKPGLSDGNYTGDLPGFLAMGLYSTFVGVCIPGKNATLLHCLSDLSVPVEYNKKYLLRGEVDFKSESTRTILEKIVILSGEEGHRQTCATAKVGVLVNEPPVQMATLEQLRSSEMDLKLKDKIVLITGASRGIGETTAKMFSLHGAKVVVNYSQGQKDAQRVVTEIRQGGGKAMAVQADVSDRDQVKQMFDMIRRDYGPIHILVNNAVRDALPIPFQELTWDDVQADINVTVKGAFHCCQEAVAMMRENGGGKIINVATVFVDNPVPHQAKYIISKSGLVGLSRSLAVELAPQGIQVNMVVPSIVETDLSKHVPKFAFEKMKNDTPMRRNATPVDVAKAIVLLASDLTPFTTGQKIMVTGGTAPFL